MITFLQHISQSKTIHEAQTGHMGKFKLVEIPPGGSLFPRASDAASTHANEYTEFRLILLQKVGFECPTPMVVPPLNLNS